MHQERFWILLSKKMAGEASMDEKNELEALIVAHPEWQYAIQNLEELWKYRSPNDTMAAEDAYMLHRHRMEEMNIPFDADIAIEQAINTPKKRVKWYAIAAAACCIGTAVAVWLYSGNSVSGNDRLSVKQENEVSTRPGSKSRIQLPDGTIVMLNAGSKLTYNKDFGKEIREVSLTGEGFFDVQRMEEKPFIIHTSNIDIKVLGTVFNVKDYPEDKKTETSLIKGSIEVTIKNRPNDKIILAPSEKLVVENTTTISKDLVGQVAKKTFIQEPLINTVMSVNKLRYNTADSTVAETQWIDNKLVFRDESFEELAVRMERWYDVTITITDERLKEKRVNGIFEKENVDQALEALKYLMPFRFEKTGNKIIIHR